MGIEQNKNIPDKKQWGLNIVQQLKQQLNKEWFVFISEITSQNFDFNFSDTNDSSITCFRYKEYEVYVRPL